MLNRILSAIFLLLTVFWIHNGCCQSGRLDSLKSAIYSWNAEAEYDFQLHLDLIEYSALLHETTGSEAWGKKNVFLRQMASIVKQDEVYIAHDFDGNYYLLNEDLDTLASFDRRISTFRHGVAISEHYDLRYERHFVETDSYDQRMFPFRKIINKKGEYIDDWELSDILFLSDGFLKVSKRGGVGVLDSMGKVVLPMSFDDVEYYSRNPNVFIVKKNKKYGVVNRYKQVLIPMEYDEIEAFGAGEPIAASKNGAFGLVDEKNQVLLPFEYETLKVFNDSVIMASKEGYEYYLMNRDFEIVSEKYAHISPYQFGERGFSVIQSYGGKGVINTNTGKTILEPIYDDVNMFLGRIWLKKNGKEGIADFNGDIIIPIEFKNIGYRCLPGRKNVLKKNGKVGMYDENNELFFDFIYSSIEIDENGDYAILGMGDSSCIMKLAGKKIVQSYAKSVRRVSYDDLLAFDKENDSKLASLRVADPVLKAIREYDKVEDHGGFAFVKKNGKWGVINHEAKLIVPVEYDDYDDFDLRVRDSGEIKLSKDGEKYRFNILGEEIPYSR